MPLIPRELQDGRPNPARDTFVEARINANKRATISLQMAIASLLRSPHPRSTRERPISKLQHSMDEMQTAFYETHGYNIEPEYPLILFNPDFFKSDDAPGRMKVVIGANVERDDLRLTQQLRNNLEGNVTPELAAKQDRLSAWVLASNASPEGNEPAIRLKPRDNAHFQVGIILKAIKNILTDNTTLNTPFAAFEIDKLSDEEPDELNAVLNDETNIPEYPFPVAPSKMLSLNEDFQVVDIYVAETEFSTGGRRLIELPLPYAAFGFLDFILTTQ